MREQMGAAAIEGYGTTQREYRIRDIGRTAAEAEPNGMDLVGGNALGEQPVMGSLGIGFETRLGDGSKMRFYGFKVPVGGFKSRLGGAVEQFRRNNEQAHFRETICHATN